jgi:hypothetical protein
MTRVEGMVGKEDPPAHSLGYYQALGGQREGISASDGECEV